MNKFKKILVVIVVFVLIRLLFTTLKFEDIHSYSCQGTQTENNNTTDYKDVVVIREYFMGSKAIINNFEQAQCSKENNTIRCATEVSGDNFNLLESNSEKFDLTTNKYQSERKSVDKTKNIDNKILIEANCSKQSDKTVKVGKQK